MKKKELEAENLWHLAWGSAYAKKNMISSLRQQIAERKRTSN